ncbi:hypothetical protein FOHLNKBM_4446 [Methylobacterium longum]|nr:hypothetical protein FOHLNKBM_4446 [Methylobacterium longum]
MRSIPYGRIFKAILSDAGVDIPRSQIVAVLRQSTAELGSSVAEVFAADVAAYPDAPPDALELARLTTCSEIDSMIRSVMVEWQIPRSADTESLVQLTEHAFNVRLRALKDTGGGAR